VWFLTQAAQNSQNAEMEDECLTEEQLQLPRQLIDSYSWLDAQTSLRIMCTLPEAILKAGFTFSRLLSWLHLVWL